MKNLLKISCRYVSAAVLITIILIICNICILAGIVINYSSYSNSQGMGKKDMETVAQECQELDNTLNISQKGIDQIEASQCEWAMYINQSGQVLWDYNLPASFSRTYSISDVATFSKWYLNDYPVFIWKTGNGIMVYGVSKDLVRYSFWQDSLMIKNFPTILLTSLIINAIIIILLALLLGLRFYKSLKPIAIGIEGIANKEPIELPEKGNLADLAHKLNITSEILHEQDVKLARRDQARTDWIAGVSHDVRTPLSLIMGWSDELTSSNDLPCEVTKKTAAIRDQSKIIKDLISDLNLTVKLEYGSQPLRKENVVLASLLRECIAQYYNQELSDIYQIIPSINKETEKNVVNVDRQLILRVFRNIIGNSIRHNPDGCDIKIEMQTCDDKISIYFSDSGSGIPVKVVDILQGKKEESSDVHIMGLRIVKQIVEAHNGKLKFIPKGEFYEIVIII